MCIRDRRLPGHGPHQHRAQNARHLGFHRGTFPQGREHWHCLLYTSDAADERSSVDLGGRRIIKKKNIGSERRWDEVTTKIVCNEVERDT